jgi:hypothetical protein
MREDELCGYSVVRRGKKRRASRKRMQAFMAVLSLRSLLLASASLAAQREGRAETGIREARPQVHKASTLVREVNPMNRQNSKYVLITVVAIAAIAMVGTLLLLPEDRLRGKIVKLEGSTITLQGEEGVVQTVQLRSVEGLTEGAVVEVEGYDPATMTGDNARVVQQD